MSEELDVAEFAREFQTFMHAMARLAPREEPSPLYQRLAEHLGRPPTGLPVVTEAYEPYEHANVQVGLDAYLAEAGRGTELLGISGGGREHQGFNDIVEAAGRHHQYDVGAVDYVTVPVSVAAERTCVSFGLYLISSGQDHIAVLLRAGSRRTGDPRVQLEVLAADADIARRFLGEVRDLVARHNTFRGQVLSFEPHAFGHGLGPLRFHPRPQVPATDVVLPAGVLAAVHRQSAGMARHRDRLLAAGHHLKRGILLFGPPGTGKTHTIRYLMGQMPEATVVILTGIGLQFVREACALARLVPPALVVLEDVDLVAQERSWVPDGGQHNPLLFQVLNEMDGMAGDADIAFVLTTNRADLIEPALAQRPGRVDLAVRVPLPDEAGRRGLLSLYGDRLSLTDAEIDEVIAATAGVTASFFAELSRRAELLAASAGHERAEIRHVRAALDELTASRAALIDESRRHREAAAG